MHITLYIILVLNTHKIKTNTNYYISILFGYNTLSLLEVL